MVTKSPPPPPPPIAPLLLLPPYTMCPQWECEERQRTNEVSIYEVGPDGLLDPRRAVSKYRRSAAAITDNAKQRQQQQSGQSLARRTYPQLVQTVQYLLELLIVVVPTTTTTTSTSSSVASLSSSFTWLDTVNFVEDRIRAVQVDLIILQVPCHQIQYWIVRVHIMILYLLADSTSYSHKFGYDALNMALSAYWDYPRGPNHHATVDQSIYNNNNNNNIDDDVIQDDQDDEMLALMLLMDFQKHYNTVDPTMMNSSSSSSFMTIVRNFYLRYYENSSRRLLTRYHHLHPPSLQQQQLSSSSLSSTSSSISRVQMIMNFLVDVSLGHWYSAIKKLSSGTFSNNALHNNASHCHDHYEQYASFGIMVRMLIAPILLPILRVQLLQAYNYSLGKKEAVSGVDVARLLSFWTIGNRTTLQANVYAAMKFGLYVGLPDNNSMTSSTMGNGASTNDTWTETTDKPVLFFKHSPIYPERILQQVNDSSNKNSKSDNGNDIRPHVRDDDVWVLYDGSTTTMIEPSSISIVSHVQEQRKDRTGLILPSAAWMRTVIGM